MIILYTINSKYDRMALKPLFKNAKPMDR
jgi:hypothetical protein